MSPRVVRSATRAAASRLSPPPTSAAIITRRTVPPAISASNGDTSSSASSPITRSYCAFGSTHRLRRLPQSRPIRPPILAIGRCPWRAPDDAVVAPSRRSIGSTPRALDDASAPPKPAEEPGSTSSNDAAAKGDDDDECPPWQNPLHHNNPEYTKVFAEEFEEGEEMPVVPLPPFETEENEGKTLAPPHLHEIADEIVRLSMLEVKELVDRVGDHFGFDDEEYVDEGGGDEGPAEEVVVEEKTAFDLKLTGFDAKSKIKVIKEIRSVTSLGLKEAKELVEGALTVIKKDVKKEEAEELKTKLEAIGATIEII